MATLAERLVELKASRALAVSALDRLVTAGGAVSIAGRTWTPIQLAELRAYVAQLDGDIARLEGRSLVFQKGTFSGT